MHLLTAQHSMDKKRKTGYAIARSVSSHKDRTGAELVQTTGLIEAKVIYFNSDMDYAIIEVSAPEPLVPIPISIRVIEGDSDLKVFHAPVGLFNQRSSNDIAIFSEWMKSSTHVDGHHILCAGGLFSGSSGAPVLTAEGYAVGMHVTSENEAKEADVPLDATAGEVIEIFSDSINSLANTHGSITRSLRFSSCPKLLEAFRTLGITVHNE
jgi:hypothetical protein